MAMEAASALTWALAIPTYNRPRILREALRLALDQTRPPAEIVVVDASRDFEASHNAILSALRPHERGVRYQHVAAEALSISVQRNQGLKLCSADIVFLFDDDSLMHEDCAERILAVYEADRNREVGGVQAAVVPEPPPAMRETGEPLKVTGHARFESLLRLAPVRYLYRRLLLMDGRELFIPYDGEFPRHRLPTALADLAVEPLPLFHGCAMTFRRDVITETGFDPLLRSYSPGDDLDATYRVSRRGALLSAARARVCHIPAAGGRIDRYLTSALSALNQAVCLRKHSSDLVRDRRAYRRLMARRLLAELLKDTLSGRWSLPQLRGLLFSLRYAGAIFRRSNQDLAGWYPGFQERLIEERAAGLPGRSRLERSSSRRS